MKPVAPSPMPVSFGATRRVCLRLCLGAVALFLSALCVAPPARGSASFPDVPVDHPYYQAIAQLSDRSIVTGYANGNFGPDDWVMRQQFAKIIVLSLELDPLPAERCPFVDVDAGWPYPRGYIAAAAANAITTGTTPTTFGPWENISRAQVVTMVVRALDNLAAGTLDVAPDHYTGTLGSFSPTHAWAMAKAEFNGLLEGLCGFGTDWDPWRNASRGEVAQILWNALSLMTPPPTVWASAAAGSAHSLALKTDGSLWAWGTNVQGQLGIGTIDNGVSVPTRVGTDSDWESVFAGIYHSLAIKRDGSLWAWGYNHSGQLGNGTTDFGLVPTRVGADNDWVLVAGGHYHTLGLRSDGSLWAWGDNAWGELGDGTTEDRLVPTRIGLDTDWVAVSAGVGHSLGLKRDGSLWAWGYNGDGRLGDGTTIERHTPTRIGEATDWKAVAAGGYHSLALKTDGSLWAWGNNTRGQLGDGTIAERHVPTRIGLDTDWIILAAAGFRSLCLKSDGSLWGWGDNDSGQLGDGSISERHRPVRIGAENDWEVFSAGWHHSLGVRAGGSLWAWGSNASGQLGDGTITQRRLPTHIATEVE